MLFLCWDEESEETEDCTMLKNSFQAVDEGREKKRKRKDSSSSTSDEAGL